MRDICAAAREDGQSVGGVRADGGRRCAAERAPVTAGSLRCAQDVAFLGLLWSQHYRRRRIK